MIFFRLFRKFRLQQDNKESQSSSLTLPSPPMSLCRNWEHDVFPSFHGPDVRKAFLCHILESFKRKGIDPFIDNNIERSKSIGPELIKAIRGSKIAIVLLSKNYASSSWCLDELAEIIKCREALGQIVLPVFYEVDPTDIKKQMGVFGKAFRKTCKGKKTKEHIERWRKALEEVATIAGEHSCNWSNEADMIEKIATDVSNILNSSTSSRDFDGLVGMRAHVEKMDQLLRLDLEDEVRMIGIWGPPGIGKTTIARVLFNKISSRFQLGAFMMNIKGFYPRPCLDEYSAQLQLQNQMLSQMTNHKDIVISHLGVAKERLKDKKVVLVLDEVDQLGQLNALSKDIQGFGPGSRIIITTEDLGVLKAHDINHIYKVNFPSSDDEAFQIFCMHAFGQKHPKHGFYELAWKVMAIAGKLPLGLKVLGAALRGMSEQEWERTLPRLKAGLDGDIESIIKFSYDALCDEYKDLFIYIACLFNSRMSHEVEEVLANKLPHVSLGIHVLVEKSLITTGFGMIGMHTLLEKFGRDMSRKKFVNHSLTKSQLLVDARDIHEVLSDDTTDNRRFIGINIDFSKSDEDLSISEKALQRMTDLQFVRIKGIDYPKSKRLHSLLNQSQKIRSLHWTHFRDKCLPSTFNPEFLVELVMRNSKLQKLWEGTKELKNLRFLNLSHSIDLKVLPDLSSATNLEELVLLNCFSLVELPVSLGKRDLTSLKILKLDNCSSLLELPTSIETATNLNELEISGCKSLVKLPTSIGNLINLKILNLENCSSLLELPPSIGTATNLKNLDMNGCSSLVKVPSSIGYLTNLEILKLNNCSSLVEVPSSIGNLQKLWWLKMCGCSKLEALPTNINLESLKTLDLKDCTQLKSFPEFSIHIMYINLIGTAVQEVPLSIMSWSRQTLIHISYFESLKKFTYAHDIITELHFLDENIQGVPPWVQRLPSLRCLRIYNCDNLESLPQLSDSVSHLVAENCQSLERLDCSFNNPKICLHFPKCFNLNQEARDLIMHTSTSGHAMLPGTQVPACFKHRATAGGSLKIKLNESPLLTSLRFKACIMLVNVKEEVGESPTSVHIQIMGKQNDLKVRCTPSSHYLELLLTEHIYTFEVEAEEVTSTELVFQFETYCRKWKIKECGLLQILEVPSC